MIGKFEIDGDLGGQFDRIGEYIRLAGFEDSLGLRRAIAAAIEKGNKDLVGRLLSIPVEKVDEILKEKYSGS